MSTTTSSMPTQPVRRRSPPEIKRHLVIVHRPGWQAIEDWKDTATRVRRIDPTTGVFIVSSALDDPAITEAAARLPTLVFSAAQLGKFKPKRGKIYHGAPIHKFEQVRRLHEAGVRVPSTLVLQPDMKPLDPRKWGEFVIVKPTDMKTSSHGLGIQLMRTERVRYIAPGDYPEGHPGRLGPMVAQQFIDTGPGISSYRVMTLFGQPLYCEFIYDTQAVVDLSASDEVIEASPVAIQSLNGRMREFRYDADVVAMARAAHNAIPEVPMKGIDVLRDRRNGLLYVIEVNPNSNTWLFSSKIGEAQRRAQGPDYVRKRLEQLDAFGTAAHVLAEVTAREAE